MSNIGLTEQGFDSFCHGAIFLLEQFYKDPVNKAAYEEWKRSREEQSNEEDNTKGRS